MLKVIAKNNLPNYLTVYSFESMTTCPSCDEDIQFSFNGIGKEQLKAWEKGRLSKKIAAKRHKIAKKAYIMKKKLDKP